MIEGMVKNHYYNLFVTPVAVRLNDKLSPNQVTLLSACFGLLVLPAVLGNAIYVAIFFLILSGYLDTLDGSLARLNQYSSNWGSVLDIMSDRFVEFIAVLALWAIAPEARGLWCLLMLGSMLLCITSFLVVGIFSANESHKSFHYSTGIMERAEALLFFCLMLLWPQAFVLLAFLFVVLVTLTAIIRLVQFYNLQQQLSRKHKQHA